MKNEYIYVIYTSETCRILVVESSLLTFENDSFEYEGEKCVLIGRYTLPMNAFELLSDINGKLSKEDVIKSIADISLAGRKQKYGQREAQKRNSESVYDENGVAYDSIRDMCEKRGISSQTYYKRVAAGKTVAEALAPPAPKGESNKKKCTDHLGTEYSSVAEMCRIYGITQNLYYSRIRLGWSVKDALTSKEDGSITVMGKKYESRRQFCIQNGINYNTYTRMIREGISDEETARTLFKTPDRRTEGAVDHLGNTYPSQKAMCQAYGVQYQTFRIRIQKGVPLEIALNPQNMKKK